MKEKEFIRRGNKFCLFVFAAAAACLIIAGCAGFGPYFLNEEVIRYDEAILQSEEQLLLLNILRMHDDQPAHFTSASGIQASFTLSSTNTLTGAISNNSNPAPTSLGAGLSLGGTISNNPSITIAPVQGKDVAERLLIPIDNKFVNVILMQHRGDMLDKVLRLTGAEFVMIGPKESAKVFEMMKNAKEPDNSQNTSKGANNPPRGKKAEDKKPLLKVKDFKGIEKGDYKYPFADVGNIILQMNDEKNEISQDKKETKRKEAIGKLIEKGFSEEEAICLLSDSCSIKNKPPRITGMKEGKPAREDDRRHYELFRKIVLHLKTLALSRKLYVSFINVADEGITGTFRKDIDFAKDGFKDAVDLYEKQYFWREVPKPKSNEAPKPESKEVTKTESEVTKKESKEVSKTDRKEVTKTDSKEVITKSEKKEVAEPAKPEGAFMLMKNYQVTVLTDVGYWVNDKDLVKIIQDNLGVNERIKLGESVILVLLRGGYPENSWPICGFFSLRNFNQILKFLAESLVNDETGYEVEYDVPPGKLTNIFIEQFNKDLESGKLDNKESKVGTLPHGCLDNPERTLAINSGSAAPVNHVNYNGTSFWISSVQTSKRSDKSTQAAGQDKQPWVNPYPPRWDNQVFCMLYEMFQFNRNAPAFTTPILTIPTK